MAMDAWRDHIANEHGAKDAKTDIASGILTYRIRGLRRSSEDDAARLAAESYGIRMIRTGGCVGPGPEWSYDMAYNRVLKEHLKARFGFDPIERVIDEARAKEQKDSGG
jgi:hypothetical protein